METIKVILMWIGAITVAAGILGALFYAAAWWLSRRLPF